MVKQVTRRELVREIEEAAFDAENGNYHEVKDSLYKLATSVADAPPTLNWFSFTTFDGDVQEYEVVG